MQERARGTGERSKGGLDWTAVITFDLRAYILFLDFLFAP